MPATNSDPEITNSHLMSENAINTQSDDDVLPAITVSTSTEGNPQLNFEGNINMYST